eukprot:jgi/Psemu1/304312/fgenesh1_kg.145_\
MQVAGIPVGLPAAALPQQATQSGTVIDHTNAGMMQLMGTAQQHHVQQHHVQQHHVQQHHAQQHHVQQQPTTQFHHDPTQQMVVGAQQQPTPQVPQHMHPQVVQQQQHHHQQHMQQTFTAMPQLPPSTGQAPVGAPLVMPPATGAPNLNAVAATPAPGTTEAQAEAQQWSEGVDPQAS